MIHQALHDFHDHRYVLTTEKNTDRHESLEKELNGWDLELFFGVDKSTVTLEQLERDGLYSEEKARKTDRSGKPMTTGHVCCSLGHRLIYEKFLETDADRVMIFEDDVQSIAVPDEMLSSALESVPEDAEMIYWGWQGGETRPPHAAIKQGIYHIQHSLGLLRYNHTMIRNLYRRPYNEQFSLAGKHFCAHAYTLNRSGAQKLIDWQTPIILNADNAIMYAILNGDLRAYISHTQFFTQASLDESSSIASLTQS